MLWAIHITNYRCIPGTVSATQKVTYFSPVVVSATMSCCCNCSHRDIDLVLFITSLTKGLVWASLFKQNWTSNRSSSECPSTGGHQSLLLHRNNTTSDQGQIKASHAIQTQPITKARTSQYHFTQPFIMIQAAVHWVCQFLLT